MDEKLTLLIAILSLNFLLISCSEKVYIIDEHQLTYRGPSNSKLYVDVEKISKIKKGKKTFILKANEIYLRDTVELFLKKNWTLKGNTGDEEMVKEQSLRTSAIKIKNKDRITIKNFHLRMDQYAPAEERSLIEIDNRKKFKGKISIKNMKLSNHYSALWIKRGQNIDIDHCIIFDNGHQINLGFLQDSLNINKYKVNHVNIRNSEIRDSKDTGNINGIKTLSNCTKINIIGNLIAANEQDGIDLFPGGLDVVIKDNIIRDNRVHGIEVKMAEKYKPSQTGQIKRVIIERNKIINNSYDGIACLDKAINYYAKGITISDNQIDSSGIYGIRSELPVIIKNNKLKNNGLIPNLKNTSNPVGYTGIYLLNVRPNSRNIIKNNIIIDQAPILGINHAYWLTMNNVRSFTEIIDNEFIISTSTINNNLNKYGISIMAPANSFDETQIRQGNMFSKNFVQNLSITITP